MLAAVRSFWGVLNDLSYKVSSIAVLFKQGFIGVHRDPMGLVFNQGLGGRRKHQNLSRKFQPLHSPLHKSRTKGVLHL